MSKNPPKEDAITYTYSIGGILAVLVIFVLVVSLGWLVHAGRNYQETFNVVFSNQNGTGRLAAQLSPDNPVPLYYLSIRGLSSWFATNLTNLRILSLVFYIIALPVAYLVGKKASGDQRAGLVSALLVGLSPFMFWYGNRATMYSLLALITLINQYFFTGILRKNKWPWPGYIISGLIGLGVHYFFVVVPVVQLAFFIIKRHQFTRPVKYLMLASCLIFALAFGSWLRYSMDHSAVWSHLPYTGKPSATNAFIILVQFLFGFQTVTTTTLIIALWPLLVVLALLSVQKYVKPPIAIQYFAFASFGTIFGVFVMSWLWRPLFLSSYLIIALPSFMIVVGWYLVAFNLKALIWARNILIAVMILMLFLEISQARRVISEDYLGLAPVKQSLPVAV
jgi:4-amino-4-deoxy-L-arabinose transferase-like glycosyltransferase